jgi:hypothetical protein
MINEIKKTLKAHAETWNRYQCVQPHPHRSGTSEYSGWRDGALLQLCYAESGGQRHWQLKRLRVVAFERNMLAAIDKAIKLRPGLASTDQPG